MLLTNVFVRYARRSFSTAGQNVQSSLTDMAQQHLQIFLFHHTLVKKGRSGPGPSLCGTPRESNVTVGLSASGACIQSIPQFNREERCPLPNPPQGRSSRPYPKCHPPNRGKQLSPLNAN